MSRRTPFPLAVGTLVAITAAAAAIGWRRRRNAFQGRVVLITGGSRGLGLVLARLFAEEGAHLVLVARDKIELERSATELRARGARVEICAGDVGQPETARRAMEVALGTFRRLDVVINCAGIIMVGPLATMGEDDFRVTMDTHLWGPYYFMQAALNHLRATQGRIVNIVSVGGKIAVPHMAPYSASKFALAGLSDGFRAEVAREGVSVTSVFPGLLRTGSHVQAKFKGDVEREFAWFALGSSTPLTSICAERAGRKIIEACRNRTPQLIVSMQAKAAVLGQALFPNIVARLSALVNAWLPQGTSERNAVPGWQARGRFPPGFVTTLADRASARNRENP